MSSLTAVLAWDYLRRNNRMLGFFFLISTFFVVGTQLLQRSITPLPESLGSFKMMVYNTTVPYVVYFIMFGMMLTQQQITQLYLKPISSFAMVGFFYLWGALLLAGQVSVIVGLGNLFFSADWSIAQTVLFSMLFWGLTHPLGIINPKTGVDVVLYFLPQIALTYWCVVWNGLAAFGIEIEGSNLRFAAIPSAASLSVTAAAFALGFCLSVWRVSRDRSGQTWLASRVRGNPSSKNKVMPTSETKPRSWAFLQESLRPLRSPLEAYQKFDFRYRTIAIPAYVAIVLVSLSLMIAFFLIIKDDIGRWPKGAFYATCGAACAQPIAAWFILAFKLANRSPMIASHSALTRSSLVKLQDSQERFFFNLPISDRDIAAATLRSSLIAVGISLLVVTVPIICFWGLGVYRQEQIRIPFMPDDYTPPDFALERFAHIPIANGDYFADYSPPDAALNRFGQIVIAIRNYFADYSPPVTALALAFVAAGMSVFLLNARVVAAVIRFKRYLLIPAGLIFVILLGLRQSLTLSLAAASLSWLLMVVIAILFVSMRFLYHTRLTASTDSFAWIMISFTQIPAFALAAISLLNGFNFISMHDMSLLSIAFNLGLFAVTITVFAAPFGVRQLRTT